jgi:uncharacterized protein (DUF2147 family)
VTEPASIARRRASCLALAALALTALTALTAVTARAASPERPATDIRGLWVDNRDSGKHKVAVWIEDCEGGLCGRIYWLRKPTAAGSPKRDERNPDAALRDRPLCGLKIMTGFRPGEAPSWYRGYIYNPNDGRTFNSTLHLEEDGTLKVRGFVGVSLFGKTVEWVRPREQLARCS